MSDGDRQDLIHSWQTDWAAGGDVVLGAFSQDTLVGGCGLHRRAGPETLEIGYWVHVDHLRNGYASEIAQALTSTAFSVPGITKVEIHHDKANTRSAAIPKALGFHFEGESPDEIAAPAEAGVDLARSVTSERWKPTPTGRQSSPILRHETAWFGQRPTTSTVPIPLAPDAWRSATYRGSGDWRDAWCCRRQETRSGPSVRAALNSNSFGIAKHLTARRRRLLLQGRHPLWMPSPV